VFDIVSAGHFAVDSIFLPDRKNPFVVLGGSVTYVSLAARRLDARVSVISKVGSDFPEAYKWWLGQEGVDLSNLLRVEETRTTRFELKYNSDFSNRALRSECRMSPITVEDISNSLRTKAVHIGPIAGEVAYDVVEKLRNCGEITSLDPQGFVRRFDENGNVTLGPLVDERVLGLIDIFKSSLNELWAVTGLSELEPAVKAIHDRGVKIVITTLGAKGAAVSVEGSIHDVPAYKPERLVDPTGAGDAFMGGFLAEYVRGEDCSWCSCVGAAVASLVVECIGPTYFGDREEIMRRARVLYEKEIKE
jgi:sugar/nucleoside kinase (ribokinase family)